MSALPTCLPFTATKHSRSMQLLSLQAQTDRCTAECLQSVIRINDEHAGEIVILDDYGIPASRLHGLVCCFQRLYCTVLLSLVACSTGLLGSAYDTAANTAHSAVTTGAGLVEKTANYIGDTAAK